MASVQTGMLEYTNMERRAIEAEISDIVKRGVASFTDPNDVFLNTLRKKASGEYQGDVIVKFGVDPTRPDIHLGHATPLRILRRLQDLGCKVVFLVGDITAEIGDPTGKSKVRPEIAFAEIEANMRTFLEQVGVILRTDPAVFSWIRNSEWFFNPTDLEVSAPVQLNVPNGTAVSFPPNSFLAKAAAFENTRAQKTISKNGITHGVTLRNFLSILRRVSHGRLIQRDMFEERLKKGEELFMHEMMYPVLQGIDSLLLARIYGSCDLEIGGNDQTFNMLMGRDIMRNGGEKPQAVLSTKLLPGTDGVEKMSKSLNNYIGVTDSPKEMFGKVMSLPDDLMTTYFELATYTPLSEIERIEKGLTAKELHPRAVKEDLAKQIVSMYHGVEKGEEAAHHFKDVFSKGGVSKDSLLVQGNIGDRLGDLLYAHNIVKSKSDWRRLVKEGAVTMITEKGEAVVDDPMITLKAPTDVRVGKHRFAKLVIK